MKTCLQCHFLAKENQTNSGQMDIFSLKKQEREAAHANPNNFLADHYTLRCYMGVWNEGVSLPDNREIILARTDRSSFCFFFPYHPGMLFPAAEELQKRTQEYAELKRSHWYTRIGLWISAIALAANVIIKLFE